MKKHNFNAGPCVLPRQAVESAIEAIRDFDNTGIGILEISHRTPGWERIMAETEQLWRDLLNIPDNYAVFFLGGGASTQFFEVPANLLKTKAAYLQTGVWAKKALKEAKFYGDVEVVDSSEDKNYTYIPDFDTFKYSENASYVHLTSNNTIFGTRFTKYPKTNAPLVADMSSNILSEKINVSDFGVIYAGAQKNIAPAGVTIVIIRNDLLGKQSPICPTMLNYAIQAKNDSLYNTPPCFPIYISMLVFRHLKKLGGVSAIQKINEYKAGLLYDFIDNSDFYTNPVNKADRSIMNVPFVTKNEELDAKFIKEATANGLVSLKGHRLAGGMRASIYNAMPVEGVKALIEFMKKFEMENK